MQQLALDHIAGDPDTGLQSTIRVDKSKHEVFVSYAGPDRDYRLTVDVYLIDAAGAPEIHLICPKCHHQLRIPSGRKAVSFDIATGKLSVERFTCTWEKADAGEHNAQRLLGGTSNLCKWTAAIDNNVARDA